MGSKPHPAMRYTKKNLKFLLSIMEKGVKQSFENLVQLCINIPCRFFIFGILYLALLYIRIDWAVFNFAFFFS